MRGARGSAAVAFAAILGALAPSPAIAYQQSLKVSNGSFLGLRYDSLSRDRHGRLYLFRATRTGANVLYAPDVEELASTGAEIRTFSTTFHHSGQALGIIESGIAVTPKGGSVFVAGMYGPDLTGGTTSPFLARYATATGKFLRGYNFDTDANRLAGGVAVDPSGTYVYVLDVPNPYTSQSQVDRVYEFDVAGLSPVRQFDLAGPADRAQAIAVAPNGAVWVQIEPSGGRTVYDQEYSSSGRYENEFISPNDATGIAIDGRGEIFSATGTGQAVKLERISTSGSLLQTIASNSFLRYPYVQTGDAHGDVFAFDDAPATSILEFKPAIPRTRITARPPSTLRVSTATFKFTATGSQNTFQCRLTAFLEKARSWSSCTSPKVYRNLSDQLYSFEVQATSLDGYTDSTPASRQFTVRLRSHRR